MIQNATDKLSQMFGGTVEVVNTVPMRGYDPSAITPAQIMFVVLAVLIFVGSLIALLIAQYSWTRFVSSLFLTSQKDWYFKTCLKVWYVC